MTPALLAPIGLAALAALIIPLVIHLRRRTEQVPTDFAALRWLRQKPKPRQRLQFDDWPLLVVRLLLLALAALLLANPVLLNSASEAPRVLVVPGVERSRLPAFGEEVRVHWLAPGFPTIDQPVPAGPLPVSSLIRQFDAELPARASLTVIVPDELQGVDAERPRLTRQVRWQVVPGRMEAPAAPKRALPRLSIRHDGGADRGLRYLRAAADAWSSDKAEVSAGDDLPAVDRVLVWLRPGAVPPAVRAWVERGGTALLAADAGMPMPEPATPVWQDDLGRPLVERASLGKGQVLRFTQPLTPAQMPQLLEPDFPARLLSALTPARPDAARVAARDFVPTSGIDPYPQPARDLSHWLALAIACLFLAERWLASSRKRVTAA